MIQFIIFRCDIPRGEAGRARASIAVESILILVQFSFLIRSTCNIRGPAQHIQLFQINHVKHSACLSCLHLLYGCRTSLFQGSYTSPQKEPQQYKIKSISNNNEQVSNLQLTPHSKQSSILKLYNCKLDRAPTFTTTMTWAQKQGEAIEKKKKKKLIN